MSAYSSLRLLRNLLLRNLLISYIAISLNIGAYLIISLIHINSFASSCFLFSEYGITVNLNSAPRVFFSTIRLYIRVIDWVEEKPAK